MTIGEIMCFSSDVLGEVNHKKYQFLFWLKWTGDQATLNSKWGENVMFLYIRI